MPVLIEEPVKIKNDDNILYNIRLKLVSEKIHEKSQDKIMFFFQVLYNTENSDLFALMEELETKEPTSIMPIFLGEKETTY